MAKKRSKPDILELLTEVFGKYPGNRLAGYLKDGACLEASVDGVTYTLEKRDGELCFEEGAPECPDISVELNRAACQYLADSREMEDFVTRTRECIDGSHNRCRMTYKINAPWPRMLMKGYLDFARKMGLL